MSHKKDDLELFRFVMIGKFCFDIPERWVF